MNLYRLIESNSLNEFYFLLSSGKSTQIDPVAPNETDPLRPFQIDFLIPAQIDPRKNGINEKLFL